MASAELKGIVKRIGQTEQVSDSFRKRELVLEIDTETQYPQLIQIEAAQDKCEDQNLNEIRVGDNVTVSFNFRGRSWNDPKKNKDVIFNTLQFWKLSINQIGSAQSTPQYAPPTATTQNNDDSEDLPF